MSFTSGWPRTYYLLEQDSAFSLAYVLLISTVGDNPNSGSKMRGLTFVTTAIFAAVLGASANTPSYAGAITTFFADDLSTGPTSPDPNSEGERAVFLTAVSAYGTFATHGVGHQIVGDTSGVWLNGDGTWLYSGSYVASYSGVTDTQTGLATDGSQVFNKGGSNTNWLGLDGAGNTLTFDNTNPTHSFGAFFTGLAGTVQVSFDDGSNQLLTIPSLGSGGGVEYVGFTDTAPFSHLIVTDVSGDNFGIDGITFNDAPSTAIPVPATLPLIASGLAALGLLRCRRKKKLPS